MAIFDTLLADIDCPHCGRSGDLEVQVKEGFPHRWQNWWRVGDEITSMGYIRSLEFDDEAACPRCSDKIQEIHNRKNPGVSVIPCFALCKALHLLWPVTVPVRVVIRDHVLVSITELRGGQ